MATKKRNWKKVERKRARFWKPTDDTGPITVKLLERIEATEGARVARARWLAEVLEPAEDLRGPIEEGSRIAIGESVVLADLLSGLAGQVVRIFPAGLDGRVRLYDVEVEEA
jgi:hypothetical protein